MRRTLLLLVASGCAGDGGTLGVPGPGCDIPFCDETGCWYRFCGGSFLMGSDLGDPDEQPVHEVTVAEFELMAGEVTIAQHDACVAGGACTDPEAADDPPVLCVDRPADAPRGCLDRAAAEAYCDWVGARLPSEAEWEFAARSGGLDRTYPWGETAPSCELAVLGYSDEPPCGDDGGPVEICSRLAGVTDQGLCDLAGNIYEWVADTYHDTYEDAPADGTAWVVPPGPFGVLRGGGTNSDEPVTTTNRTFHEPTFTYSGSGVRCAR